MVPLKRAIAYDAPRVVINEIMYNPQSDVDGDEFLEVYNTTASTIDISGWCFTRGITLCFDSGTSLAGHAYGVISRDATQTLATYGVATIGTYTGKLDNGGERITLVDEASQVVVDFTYDDVSPWPTSPDGTGPSLELKDPTFDYTLASSWAASIGSPTPLADNSVLNLDLPELSNVSQASAINANDSVTITATVANGADVELVYKVAFDSDQTIAMYDDGAHGDGASGDDVYGGVIPGQEAGTLIRYKVQATNNNGTASKPSNDDSINYYGYMVRNPSQSVDAPTINWFIDDTDYDQLIQETVDTPPNEYPCVIVYGDQVFDNARVRIKGEYSSQLQFAKRPYKVTLPTGYTLSIPEISPYPLRQFHLNSDFTQNTYVTSLAAWDVAAYAGLADHPRGKILLRRNGAVEGAYTMMEKFDKEWRQTHYAASGKSYDTGLMYEDYWELSSGSDPNNTLRNTMYDTIKATDSPERSKYAMDNLDIPNMINYLAVMAVIRQHDWSSSSNTILYLDQQGSGRWSALPWDFDIASSSIGTASDIGLPNTTDSYMISPYQMPQYLRDIGSDKVPFTVLWDDPVLRQMYLRRVRTLVDEVYASGRYEQYLDNQLAAANQALDLDYDKWITYAPGNDLWLGIIQYLSDNSIPNDAAIAATVYESVLGPNWNTVPWSNDFYASVQIPHPYDNVQYTKLRYRDMVNTWKTTFVQDGYMLESAPTNPTIKITELNYNPAGGSDDEYLELYNPSNTPIDLSGWTFDGIDFTVPGGGVLPAGGYGVVVKNDQQFRQTYGGGQYVLGGYGGNLANEGETITLRRQDNSISDQVTYAPANSGPTGHSLELMSMAANGAKTSCWVPSSGVGTPALANMPNAAAVAASQATCLSSQIMGARDAILHSYLTSQSQITVLETALGGRSASGVASVAPGGVLGRAPRASWITGAIVAVIAGLSGFMLLRLVKRKFKEY